jgi:hypothetical protein
MKKLLAALLFCVSPAAAQQYAPGSITPQPCGTGPLVANTALTIIPANTVPHGWRLENLDTTEGLWWSVTGPAVINATGSFVLGAATATTFAGAMSVEPAYGFGTQGALSIIATTAGHKFACMYW